MKLARKTAVRSCVMIVAGATLMLPAAATAETSSQQHTMKGELSFSCSSPSASLNVGGSEASGYLAFVRVAEVGGTRYYAGGSAGDPAEVTYEHGNFVATVPVRTAPFPSAPKVGLLTITADLVAGRVQVMTGGGAGSGDANQQTASVSRSRLLMPTGDVRLTAPNGAESVEHACSGSLSLGGSTVSSDPHATVATHHQAFARCESITVGENEYFLQMSRTAPDTTSVAIGPASDGEGDYYLGSVDDGADEASWSRGLSIDLFNPDLYDPPVGATLTIRFVPEQSAAFPIYSGTWSVRTDATVGRIKGLLAFVDGPTVSVACDAFFVDERFIGTGDAPSNSGPAPSNDLPSGARLLAVGARTTAQTTNAAPSVEAPVECMLYEDGTSAVTNTVWYTVTGSGPVTIDTAGTRFDTALAVYSQDAAGALVPVPDACADDTWTLFGPLAIPNLQASLTFDAQPGVTYLIQVGGTDADLNFGTLHVSASGPG